MLFRPMRIRMTDLIKQKRRSEWGAFLPMARRRLYVNGVCVRRFADEIDMSEHDMPKSTLRRSVYFIVTGDPAKRGSIAIDFERNLIVAGDVNAI